MSANDWLAQLKEGDTVIVRRDGHRSVSSVRRLTPTQIVTPGARFRKSDGRQVGENVWHPCQLEQATAEQVEIVRANAKHRKLSNEFKHSVDWSRLPLSVLEQINAVLEAHANAEKVG